jgi:hypothetical protein
MNTLMNRLALALSLASALSLVATPPALALSSTASSASEGASASVGSLSDSVRRSSNSSASDNKVAEGDYRIIDVARVAEQPGTVVLKLQALADASPAGELLLHLPQQAIDQSGLAAGQVVSARLRPYGVEFAKAADGTAFFLALSDGWMRELQSHPVSL